MVRGWPTDSSTFLNSAVLKPGLEIVIVYMPTANPDIW